MTLKIKDKKLSWLKIKNKKIIWTKLYFRQFYNDKIWITWGFFVYKEYPDPVFSRIRVTQKDRIRIRNTALNPKDLSPGGTEQATLSSLICYDKFQFITIIYEQFTSHLSHYKSL